MNSLEAYQYVNFKLGDNEQGMISDIYYVPDSKYVVVGGTGASNITIVDFTNMQFLEGGKATLVSGLQKPKYFAFYEKDRSKNWLVIVNDDVRIVSLSNLALLQSKELQVGPGSYGVQFFPQGNTFVTLTRDGIFFYNVEETPVNLNLVVSEGLTDALGVSYNTHSNYMFITKTDGFYKVKIDGTPQFCHPNCKTCTSNFDWNVDYCTECETGSEVKDGACKKASTGAVLGGNLVSIPDKLTGELTLLVKDETIDPNANKTTSSTTVVTESNMNSLMVLFAILGGILLLILIVVFGMVNIYLIIFRLEPKEAT